MNDPGALLAFFAVSVVIWVAFITVVAVIIQGRAREKYQSGVHPGDVEHPAHGDDADR